MSIESGINSIKILLEILKSSYKVYSFIITEIAIVPSIYHILNKFSYILFLIVSGSQLFNELLLKIAFQSNIFVIKLFILIYFWFQILFLLLHHSIFDGISFRLLTKWISQNQRFIHICLLIILWLTTNIVSVGLILHRLILTPI